MIDNLRRTLIPDRSGPPRRLPGGRCLPLALAGQWQALLVLSLFRRDDIRAGRFHPAARPGDTTLKSHLSSAVPGHAFASAQVALQGGVHGAYRLVDGRCPRW